MVRSTTSSNLCDRGPDHVPLQAKSKRAHTYELPIGPKTGRSLLGLTFSHPTSRSFVAKAKTATTMKETVASVYSLACSWGDTLKLTGRLQNQPLFSTSYYDSPDGWTFLQVRKGCMVRSSRSLCSRKGELFVPRHAAHSIPVIRQGQGQGQGQDHPPKVSKPKRNANSTRQLLAGTRRMIPQCRRHAGEAAWICRSSSL
jgi:hypothetical protein